MVTYSYCLEHLSPEEALDESARVELITMRYSSHTSYPTPQEQK